jgi:DNA modification methylase
MNLNHIYTGDALEVLKTLPDNSVHCCITSPPYYGLRNYGVDGQIGLEDTPEEYIDRLAAVFMEVRRVLKHDGTLWIVIGDSYAGSGRGIGDVNKKGIQQKASYTGDLLKPCRFAGYKNKDLMGVPWRLAFALREAGWYLRQDIIWHKPNPMPESIRDRCTKAHEYVFLLSKSAKYYFDHAAMLEPAMYDGRKDTTAKGSPKYATNSVAKSINSLANGVHEHWPHTIENLPARNRRSVWTVPTHAYRGAHFATFPPDLIKTCIAAGSPHDGIVLDPFMGAGTTGLVAKQLGRHYIGIELNSDYIKLAQERITGCACL